MTTTSTLISNHEQLWHDATHATFLDGIADGTLPREQFSRWLEQDHAFADNLVRAWGRMLASAPRCDYALISTGIAAFEAELQWFEGIADDEGITLGGPLLPAARAYNDAVSSWAAADYPIALVAMWAVEQAYWEAWRHVAPGAPDFQRFVEHWVNPEFDAFVAQVAEAVNRELPDGPTDAATTVFCDVARHEHAFWQMTVTG